MPVNSFVAYPMTWKPEKERLKRPIYLSLANQLEADIAAGVLAPGTKLPPQRELADYLDLNFTTITRCYKLCEMRGLVYAKTGSGTFVSPHAAHSVTISTENIPPTCIDLAFVASFEQCNDMVTETVKKVTGKRYFAQLLDYNDPTGMPHQKQAAIEWMRGFGVQTDESHLALVSGAQNALALALLALFSAGDRIAVDTYTYANFISLAKLHHIHLLPVAGDGQGMLPEALDMQCSQNKVNGIFLMPSCGNPTTIMISERRKHALAAVIRKHRLILIEDDIHVFLTAGVVADYEGPLSRLVPEQSVYICSTSKALCSGLRVAYMVFGEPLRDMILQAIYNVNVKTSGLNAEIVTELLVSGQSERIIAAKKQLAVQANALFDQYFPDAPKEGHPLSFFRWLPVPVEYHSLAAEERLLQSGVRVFHSSRFMCGAAKQEQFFRVSLANTASMEQLRLGLEILQKCLRGGG